MANSFTTPDFTTQMPEPGRVDTRVTPVESTSGVLGDVAGSIAQAGKGIFDYIQGQDKSGALGDLESKLYPEVQRFATQPSAPNLLGQTSGDNQTDAANSAPGVQAANQAMDKFGQITQANPNRRDEFYARTAAVVQSAIFQHPEFADAIRARAQQVLGLQPTQKMVDFQTDLQKNQDDLNRGMMVNQAQAAEKAGIVYTDPNGNYDLARTAQAGINLNKAQEGYTQMKEKLEIQNMQAEIDARNATAGKAPPLTAEQQDNATENAFSSLASPVFADHVMSQIENLNPATIRQQHPELNTPQAETAYLNSQIAQSEQNWNVYLTKGFMEAARGGNPINDKVQTAIRGQYKAYFDGFRTQAGGGLDAFATSTRAVTGLVNGNKIGFHDAAPAVSRITDTLGPNATAPIIQATLNATTAANGNVQKEVQGWVSPAKQPPSVVGAIHATADVANGDQTHAQLPNDQYRAAVINNTAVALQNWQTRPNQLQGNELNAYGNLVGEATKTGLNSGDPDQLRSASRILTNGAALQVFDRFASDHNHQADAKVLGNNLGNLAARSLTFNAAHLQDLAGNDEQFRMRDTAKPAGQVTAQYNAATGKIEIQNNTGQPVPQDYQTRVEQMNSNLNAAQHLKGYAGDEARGMSDAQYKGSLIVAAGIPIKPGSDLNMPSNGKQANAEPARVNGPLGTLIDTYSHEEGVDPRLAHAFAIEESSGNPNVKTSSTGAIGPYQLEPGTAKDMGVDPTKLSGNVQGGIRYIAQLMKKYGDVEHAAVAYIAGPQRMAQYFANPEKFPNTHRGVTRIMGMMGLDPTEGTETGDHQVEVTD